MADPSSTRPRCPFSPRPARRYWVEEVIVIVLQVAFEQLTGAVGPDRFVAPPFRVPKRGRRRKCSCDDFTTGRVKGTFERGVQSLGRFSDGVGYASDRRTMETLTQVVAGTIVDETQICRDVGPVGVQPALRR
jgi:hypothetical protein